MSKPKNVVSLFERSRKKVPELALDIPTKSTAKAQETGIAAYVIPSNRPELILVIGSGNTGKSLVLRPRDGMTLATLAPNRTLKRYFPETAHPEGNSTSDGAVFLNTFFDVVARFGSVNPNAISLPLFIAYPCASRLAQTIQAILAQFAHRR